MFVFIVIAVTASVTNGACPNPGFGGYVVCSHRGLTTIPQFSDETVHLHLDHNNFPVIPNGSFTGLLSLKDLRLSNCHINTIEAGAFTGLTALRKLYLYSNSITTIPKDFCTGCTNLMELDFYINKLTTIARNPFAHLPSLQILILSSNNITTIDKDAFTATSLEELYLIFNNVKALHKDTFKGLTSLKIVRMFKNSLRKIPMGTFTGLTSLQELGLQWNPLDCTCALADALREVNETAVDIKGTCIWNKEFHWEHQLGSYLRRNETTYPPKYYLEGGRQSCDQICQKHGSVCTATCHRFTNANTLAIFGDKGVNCTTGNETDTYTYPESPMYVISGCIGWKDIPTTINCSSTPAYSFVERLCPCFES